MFVGVCRVVLHLPGNHSLKGKRRVIRSIIDRTAAKFNVSVAEVSDNDLKKRAVIGAAVIGNSAKHVDSMLSRIGGFIEWIGLAEVVSIDTEVIPIGGDLGIDGDVLPGGDGAEPRGEGEDNRAFADEDMEW